MVVKIEKLDHQGNGIAFVDKVVTFIPKTVPGDIVEIDIKKKKKNFNQAKLVRVIEPSPKRIDATCPFYELCGGCDLQNLDYEETLNYKKEKVINIFKRINIDVNPIVIKNDQPFYYRNKIELKIKNKKIGFYQEKTNNIIDINNCMITKKCINKVIPFIKSWNIIDGEIILRCNQNNEILIIINSKDKVSIDISKLIKEIKLVGIVHNNKTIYGENFLFEIINGILFKISYDSFFQINVSVAEKLFKIVEENIESNSKVLDLFSGVGTLSLSSARKAKSVVGIEIIPNAVLNAITNSQINRLENTSFVLNDVSDAIAKINQDFDTWIIDPPRSGIDKNTLKVIKDNLPSKIIYVSCDPQTLVRDISVLKDYYNINKIYILDMFSYTYHCETICILKIKKGSKL